MQELQRAAGQLSSRRISALIANRPDLPGCPSHEGVRTALNGLHVPKWDTVRAIVAVLADQCDPPRDPQGEVRRFERLWRAVHTGEAGTMRSARELTLHGWGGENGEWTPELVAGMVLNPFNAVEIHPSLAVPHEPLLTEDDWVSSGVRLIEEHGAEFALRALLRILKGDYIGAESGSPYGYQDPDYEALEMHLGFRYGCQEIVRRLRAEPNLLPASIRAMHADDTMNREDRIEMLRAEADHSLLREVMTLTPDTWDEISEEAQHQVFGYLVKSMIPVGRPGQSPSERFLITWRIPESRSE
ncbi:hypothetical protein BX285_2700 [Streptomyces sp. 1114.5]|uniref:hypothetical protein n=1 Tax=Streptomyces sp. 1114.5 TaxID=1938830 RepID=UPI000F2644B8|nr:hypothetical protein [Streptomyces sp. 1114.5]RKT18280.1 hypothetical protein BX285_2700 [Streptomyces sp. 1114.5]